MKAILRLWLPAIRKRYATTRAVEAQLLRISPRTIDRALKGKKRELLNDLYRNELRLYMNLFQPSVKLIRTERKGSRKVR